jgi:hypothetical protein
MPNMGKIVETGPWTCRQEFEFDYRHQVPKKEVVVCPQCSGKITCDRMMGLGDPRTGWCETCKKGVEGTPVL